MSTDFRAGVVRILSTSGETSGTGFLVSTNRGNFVVLTCSHVVQDEMSQRKNNPLPKQVRIIPELSGQSVDTTLIPECWSPIDQQDIAALAVDGGLPAEVQPLQLGSASGTRGHSFESRGYRLSKYFASGLDSIGEIQGVTRYRKQTVLQLASRQIDRGMSGAPVWDVTRQRVVGMVNSFWRSDGSQDSDLVLATATSTLKEICPTIDLSDICPYQGLSAFTEHESEFFFGRARAIAALIENLTGYPRLLAIIGSSGSGKSSVVQAGLIPAIRGGQVPGLNPATIVRFTPGSTPQNALISALRREVILPSDVEDDRLVLNDLCWQQAAGRLVLFADQFESLFALAEQPKRDAFLETLALLVEGSSAVTLILALRAAFYDHLLRSSLGPFLKSAQVNLERTSKDEIAAIIINPAKALGLQFESGLAEMICEEAGKTRNPLPLLEFSLTQLWNERSDGVMTHAAYNKIGGVSGAITQWASDSLGTFTRDERELARRLFTRLIRYGEGDIPDSRQKLPLSVFVADAEDKEVLHGVASKLANAHLLVTDVDVKTGEETLEIVHDRLLHEWKQLRVWIEERRDFLLWRQRLDLRLGEWKTMQRDDGMLLRGASLNEACTRVEQEPDDLSSAEILFIELSVAQRDREAAVVRHRLILLISSLSAGLLLISALASWGFMSARKARTEATNARKARMAAVARGLAAQGMIEQANFRLDDLGALLARQAYLFDRLNGNVSRDQVDMALRSVVAIPYFGNIFKGNSKPIVSIVLSQDGKILVTGGDDMEVRLWNLQQSSSITLIEPCYSYCYGQKPILALSPDGHMLAVVGDLGLGLRLFDLENPLIAPASSEETLCDRSFVNSMAFSPNSALLLVGCGDGAIRLLDWKRRRLQPALLEPVRHYHKLSDPPPEVWRECETCVEAMHMLNPYDVSVLFNGNSKILMSFADNGTIRMWNWPEPSLKIFEAVISGIESKARFALASDKGLLAADRSFKLYVWNLKQRSVPPNELGHCDVRSLAFSHDEKILACGSSDGTIWLWDTEHLSEEPLPLRGHRGAVNAIVFSYDGNTLISGSDDRILRLWDLRRPAQRSTRLQLPPKSSLDSAQFALNDRTFVTVGESPDQTFFCDLDGTCAACHVLNTTDRLHYDRLAISPDGNLLLARDDDHWVLLHPREPHAEGIRHENTGERRAGYPFQPAPAFSRDGKTAAVVVGTVESERYVDVWNWGESKKQSPSIQMKFEPTSLCFSQDGTVLAIGDEKGNVELWDKSKPAPYASAGSLVVNDGTKQTLHSDDRVLGLKFSFDGSYLIWMQPNGSISMWNWRHPNTIPTTISGCGASIGISGYKDDVPVLEVSPNGSDVACGGADGSLWLWNTSGIRSTPAIFYPHKAPVLAISIDSKRGIIKTIHSDGVIVSSDSTDVLADVVCTKVRRNLLKEEWNNFVGADFAYELTCANLPSK